MTASAAFPHSTPRRSSPNMPNRMMGGVPLTAPGILTVDRRITRIGPQGRREVTDCLLREERFVLRVNGAEAACLHCMPCHLEALAVGHLFTSGRLRHAGEVRHLRVDIEQRLIEVQTESCAPQVVAPAAGEVQLSAAQVHRLQENFEQHCGLFRQTGAVHSCALATPDGVVLFLEDIARHNALDKVIGAMLLQGLSAQGKVMIFSGRLALDMLSKVVACGVRLLIAPGAPSLASVEMAEAHGITLLGFVRADNINIYTCPHRVV